MKAIVLDQPNQELEQAIDSLRIVEKPIPSLRYGQVLIKMEKAPCNPSDLLFLQGTYGVRKRLPAAPGWEGAGTVVKSGGGFLSWWLKSKRVACAGQSSGDGTWAEYFVADANKCIPLNEKISFEQGATLIINPLTAYGLVSRAKKGYRAIVQTAALSQVGCMVRVLAKQEGIAVIDLVRRKSQVEELSQSEWVVNTEETGWGQHLIDISKNYQPCLAFDAVAGHMTGHLLKALPAGSHVLVYGSLSGKECSGISPIELIFQKKSLSGFWLTNWFETTGLLGTLTAINKVQKLMASHAFETKIARQVNFQEWKLALKDYARNMTQGKMLLSPSM